MSNYAAQKQARRIASASFDKSVIRPAAKSSTQSTNRTLLAAICGLIVAAGPLDAQQNDAGEQAAEVQKVSNTVVLTSGTYQGVWRDEDGNSGETRAVFNIDGESVKGRLTLSGVDKYSGDRISGKAVANADGTLSVEFKTRDGKWKSSAVFDGQLLIGTYYYEYLDRRVQKLVKGEWAAQQVPD